jgi:hypothetical protein
VEHGQLGTEVQHRVIFVWEGAVASLPDNRATHALEAIKRRMALWNAAVRYWEINPMAVAAMWQIHERTTLRIDLAVTSRGPNFAIAVAKLIQDRNWPVRSIFCETPDSLGRMLPQMPDVDRVYYGMDEHRWALGPRGMFFDPRGGQIV